jgi:hypothetical protein
MIHINCTSTKNYFINRKNDFLDIFNLSVEKNSYGIGFYGLPFFSGLFYGRDAEGYGVRYGTVGGYYAGGRGIYMRRLYNSQKNLDGFKENDECFEKYNCAAKWWLYAEQPKENFGNQLLYFGDSLFHEPKQFTNRTKNKFFTLMSGSGSSTTSSERGRVRELYFISHPMEPGGYTRFPLEFSIGVHYGIRFGLTITEFFDFILGMVGIDFMDDDNPNEVIDKRNYVKDKFSKLPIIESYE